MVRQAHHTGMMRTKDLLFGIYLGFLYKMEWRETMKIINAMAMWMKGVSLSEFEQLADEVVKDYLIPEIRPELIDEIALHRANGAKNVMLSAAMAQVCYPISDHLNLDDVICSHFEVKDGRFTGRPIGRLNFASEKFVSLEKYYTRFPSKIENDYYYADSISDVSVLDKIGNPVCVDPDRQLARLSRKKGWRIIP